MVRVRTVTPVRILLLSTPRDGDTSTITILRLYEGAANDLWIGWVVKSGDGGVPGRGFPLGDSVESPEDPGTGRGTDHR